MSQDSDLKEAEENTCKIYRAHIEERYFICPNAIAQCPNMTMDAQGVLIYLLSLPSNWNVRPKNIWKAKNIARDKVYSAIKELCELGYMNRVSKPHNQFDYYVCSSPIYKKPDIECKDSNPIPKPIPKTKKSQTRPDTQDGPRPDTQDGPRTDIQDSTNNTGKEIKLTTQKAPTERSSSFKRDCISLMPVDEALKAKLCSQYASLSDEDFALHVDAYSEAVESKQAKGEKIISHRAMLIEAFSSKWKPKFKAKEEIDDEAKSKEQMAKRHEEKANVLRDNYGAINSNFDGYSVSLTPGSFVDLGFPNGSKTRLLYSDESFIEKAKKAFEGFKFSFEEALLPRKLLWEISKERKAKEIAS